MEKEIKQILRVPFNVNELPENSIKACISIAEDIGIEAFKNSNLVKYINNSVHINNVNIQNDNSLTHAKKFVKAGIAYWILKLANTTEELERRKQDIKLYFS